jgi:tetratricopeptide (TPR) repeat protein
MAHRLPQTEVPAFVRLVAVLLAGMLIGQVSSPAIALAVPATDKPEVAPAPANAPATAPAAESAKPEPAKAEPAPTDPDLAAPAADPAPPALEKKDAAKNGPAKKAAAKAEAPKPAKVVAVSAKAKADAEALSKQAAEYLRTGTHSLAADTYLKAHSLNPLPEYLYGAARAEHLAGQLESAIATYEQTLAALTPKQPLYKKVKAAMDMAKEELAARPAPTVVEAQVEAPEPENAKPVPIPQDPTPVVVQAPPPSAPLAWEKPVGYGALGLGAVALLSGIVVYATASTDQAALDDLYAEKSDQGITGITREDAIARQDSINSRVVTTWALIGTGVVSAGAGAYLLWFHKPAASASTAAPAVVAVPVRDGGLLQLAWRF